MRAKVPKTVEKKNSYENTIMIIVGVVLLIISLIVLYPQVEQQPKDCYIKKISDESRKSAAILMLCPDQHLISGVYNDDKSKLQFASQRGEKNPLIERIFFNAQKYSVSACFVSEQGEAFSVLGGCPLDPKQNAEEIPIEQRAVEWNATWNIAKMLTDTKLPKEFKDTKQALINLAKTVTEKDIEDSIKT